MILGKIFGKVTTMKFQFKVEKETRKFDFVQVLHKVYDYVLCQVVEIERTEYDMAKCIIIGYKDDKGRVKPIRIPFDIDSEVLKADEEFIRSIIKMDNEDDSAYMGKLEGKNIDIFLDLKKLLTKHIAILAKSGAGKSYTVGVLIEEIIRKKVPIMIIDPHGEYGTLKIANKDDEKSLAQYNLKPKGFDNIREYGDSKINPGLLPLKLNNNLNPTEVAQLIPGKLSNSQMGLLYSATKGLDVINFTNILLSLEVEESNAKWSLINNLEYLNNLDLFSDSYSSYNELIQPGRCSIINLKGIPPDVQQIIVYKLIKDLFELRKKEKIPPFFTVIEEAHNYCPERSFGEARSSKILRTVASEGRKFGLGLCVVSQRPARVDKSVLSQCTTQIIMKVTNPQDIKAISSSVEGINAESEDEIKNLPVGSTLITGVFDMPLFVNIRPRMSKHGGEAVEILELSQDEKFFDKIKEFEEKEMLPLIKPKTTIKDIKLMSEKPIKKIENVIYPGYLFLCSEKRGDFNILVEMVNGEIVTNIEEFKTKKLPNLSQLKPIEIKVLHTAFNLKEFNEDELIQQGISMDVSEILKELIKKKFIIKDEKYKLSDEYVLSHLSKNACLAAPKR